MSDRQEFNIRLETYNMLDFALTHKQSAPTTDPKNNMLAFALIVLFKQNEDVRYSSTPLALFCFVLQVKMMMGGCMVHACDLHEHYACSNQYMMCFCRWSRSYSLRPILIKCLKSVPKCMYLYLKCI